MQWLRSYDDYLKLPTLPQYDNNEERKQRMEQYAREKQQNIEENEGHIRLQKQYEDMIGLNVKNIVVYK
jgi:hypothetical protein